MKKNKYPFSTLLIILWLLLPSMVLQSQSTQAYPLACNNCGTEVTIVPSSQVICGEEVELEAQFGDGEVYDKIEWLQEGQTIAVGETAIRVGEAGTYILKVTFGDNCTSRTSITLKNSEAYFKDNCFISIPIDGYTPIDGSGLNTTGSQSRSRMDDLEVTIGGMVLSIQGMTGGAALVSTAEDCEALSNNINRYEEGEQVLAYAEENILYLGSNQSGKTIIDDYLKYWQQRTREEGEEKDILSAPFEFNCGSEQFFASEVSDHWLYLVKILFACSGAENTSPEGKGVVPKCFWECALILPSVSTNIPFHSGVIDGAYEMLVGTADMAKLYVDLLELETALIKYPICKGLGIDEVFYEQLQEREKDETWLEGLKKSIDKVLGNIGIGTENCEEVTATLNSAKNKVEKAINFLSDLEAVSEAWEKIKQFMGQYYTRITTCTNLKTCNVAFYEQGKLLFNLASIIAGIGVEEALIKSFGYISKLLSRVNINDIGKVVDFSKLNATKLDALSPTRKAAFEDASLILPPTSWQRLIDDPDLLDAWTDMRALKNCVTPFRSGGASSRSNGCEAFDALLKKLFVNLNDNQFKLLSADFNAVDDLVDDFLVNPNLVNAWKDWSAFPNLRKRTDLLANYYPTRTRILLDVEETLGGHSIARHGHHLSLSEMQQRVLGTHSTLNQSRSALRFDNEGLHKNAVDQAFNARKADIEAHFDSGQTSNFEVEFDFGSQVGAGYTNTGTLNNPTAVAVTSNKVKLVFKADSSNPTGYKLLTAYPSYP